MCSIILTVTLNFKKSQMKVVLFFASIILASLHSYAQDRNEIERRQMNNSIVKDNLNTIKIVNKAKKMKLNAERSSDVTMKNNKMLVVQNGKTNLMRNNVTMRNGTIIMPNGIIFLSDFGGTVFMMRNGMYIDKYGKIKYPSSYYRENYQH